MVYNSYLLLIARPQMLLPLLLQLGLGHGVVARVLSKLILRGQDLVHVRRAEPVGQRLPDGLALVLHHLDQSELNHGSGGLTGAVKRSIGFIIGFHNHGEGGTGRAAIRHYANQPARPL